MVTLGDIFRQYGPQYRERYADRLSASQRQALHAIETCRTEALGGHVYQCAACGETRYSYHSCRNRHCPQCQHAAAQQWLTAQQDLLLPVPYFLLTFTLPAELRGVARQHPRLIYNLLFRASAAAAQELARDPRFIGGQLGLIGILQTWARNLTYHPHIHYLVPGGGWDPATQVWHAARPDFLLPVKALSILFRAKFRDGLRKSALFRAHPARRLATRVGGTLPAGRQWRTGAQVPGALRLPGRHQQSTHRQSGTRSGQLRLHRCAHPPTPHLYPGRARLH